MDQNSFMTKRQHTFPTLLRRWESVALRFAAFGPNGITACFIRNQTGSFAIWFGLSILPLFLVIGAGVDLSRSLNQKAELQGAADAAALAGASAYVSAASSSTAVALATKYMDNFKATSGLPVTYTVTPTTSTSGSTITLYKMKVTASAPISNTIMALTTSTNAIGATSSAQNPVYNITINLGSFNSSAADLNTISYYKVPPDNSAPAAASTTQIFSNDGASANSSVTISVTASEKIGFMLTNTTGGKPSTTCNRRGVCTTTYPNGYGSNQYYGAQGSTHNFYSHMMPPSKVAYPSVTSNCSLQVLTTNASPSAGGCSSSLPANAAVNCVDASGQTLYFNWNDMGGTSDDKDYNDAVYNVGCSKVDSSVSKGLVLTN